MRDPTTRFSSRVENYVLYRPGYPSAVLDLLRRHCKLDASSIIVDVGSGTGKLSELFLQDGLKVYGVEPNPDMRTAAERMLGGYEHFASIAGTAEVTNLPTGCAHLVVAGQAFHWFNVELSRVELARVLSPSGWAALIWNVRSTDATPFLRDYEALLRSLDTDYGEVKALGDEDSIERFFGDSEYTRHSFPNHQDFDFDGLLGRLLSSSYSLEPGAPGYEAMVASLHSSYNKHAADGRVRFEYETQVYCGLLKAE